MWALIYDRARGPCIDGVRRMEIGPDQLQRSQHDEEQQEDVAGREFVHVASGRNGCREADVNHDRPTKSHRALAPPINVVLNWTAEIMK